MEFANTSAILPVAIRFGTFQHVASNSLSIQLHQVPEPCRAVASSRHAVDFKLDSHATLQNKKILHNSTDFGVFLWIHDDPGF